MDHDQAVIARPSVWRSPFAARTALAGLLWLAGVAADWASASADPGGWLAFRTDVGGLLLTAAALAGGWNFAGAGLRAARRLRLDMNFLMTAALAGALLIGEPFEAATLAFLFSLAELLEQYAVDRGRRSIERLLALAPEQAERLSPDGSTTLVPASSLGVGDLVRVRPGGLVPADGRVEAGASAVNEATITGESVPRLKGPGDAVFTSTFNTDGVLDIRVTADAAHSVLARIVQLVKAAESRRAPVEYAVRRFARVYTPAVLILAIAVMLLPPLILHAAWSTWVLRSLTLLVIACPCALVIATPVTIVSALTSAARHGVLIKGGEFVETLGAVRALAIDKTGTLTTGALQVAACRVDPPGNVDWLLAAAAAIELRSEHPVAHAIVRYARVERPGAAAASVSGFTATPGRGVRALVDGVEVRIGTEAFVGRAAPDGANPGRAQILLESERGRITFELRDSVRPAAGPALDQLRRLGIAPIVLLTGDHAVAAAEVARSVGITDVRARLLPEQKVAAVAELRERYGTVAMIGDGVNDAPALAEASLGIAMGAAGSPATIESADVALMGDDLSLLPYAVMLARRSRRIIRFNITVAIVLKLVLAAGTIAGQVSLALAVLLGDMGGTLIVTGNALRLARLRTPHTGAQRDGETA